MSLDNYQNYRALGEYDNTPTEEEEEHLMDQKGQGESECCGAGTYGDYKICEDCGEHC